MKEDVSSRAQAMSGERDRARAWEAHLLAPTWSCELTCDAWWLLPSLRGAQDIPTSSATLSPSAVHPSHSFMEFGLPAPPVLFPWWSALN